MLKNDTLDDSKLILRQIQPTARSLAQFLRTARSFNKITLYLPMGARAYKLSFGKVIEIKTFLIENVRNYLSQYYNRFDHYDISRKSPTQGSYQTKIQKFPYCSKVILVESVSLQKWQNSAF